MKEIFAKVVLKRCLYESGFVKWYDFVTLSGVIITLIGIVVFSSVAPLDGNSPGLLILVFGIVVMVYGYALRFFDRAQKKRKVYSSFDSLIQT